MSTSTTHIIPVPSPEVPSGQPADPDALVALLAEQMAGCWRQGACYPAEHFLEQHPALRASPDAVMDLLYEEICLSRELGHTVDPEQLFRRFPHWRREIEILLNCVNALEGPPAPRLPAAGETFGDFHLLAQLGRGGQGVVFAGTQSSLGNRPVVLKITSRRGDEHLSLARLQHTHIVPLLSCVEDTGRNLRVLCMPYLGGLTLAAVLTELSAQPVERRSGRDILACLDRARAAAPIDLSPGRDPARRFFEQAEYVRAVAWLGACLAEALKYAHERGLVHLDLKPSNVLLTADAEPMLLDFHLAREAVAPGDAGFRFGGTPTYMSPEQKRAMAAIKAGGSVPEAVDQRSDIYSLGLVLYEALGRTLPEGEAALVPLRRLNPRVSPGLSDLVGKCLAPNPRDRYQEAGVLAADLWAHLDNLPLKGVGNRSPVERWRKWRRRKPHSLSLLGMIVVVALLGTAAVAISLVHLTHRKAEARNQLADGTRLLQAGRPDEASAAFKRARSQLESWPGTSDLKRQLDEQLRAAARSKAAQELHHIADRFRFQYGLDFSSLSQLPALEGLCRSVWEKRELILDRVGKELEPVTEKQLQIDLLDLAVLGAELHVRLAGKKKAEAARQQALKMLGEAESLFGPNALLYHERRLHAEALGLEAEVREAARHATEYPPRTAWEHYALGRALLRSEKLEAATSHLRQALHIQPGSFWPSFYHGVCCYRLAKQQDLAAKKKSCQEAVISFSTCAALKPNDAHAFHYRGLALVELNENDMALADFDRALAVDPDYAEASHSRGLLHLHAGRLPQAARNFQDALAHGANPARAHFHLALVCVAQKDRAGAISHLEQAQRLDPSRSEAAQILKKLRQQRP